MPQSLKASSSDQRRKKKQDNCTLSSVITISGGWGEAWLLQDWQHWGYAGQHSLLQTLQTWQVRMNLVAEYDVSLKEVVIQFGAFEVSATVIRPLFVKSFIYLDHIN